MEIQRYVPNVSHEAPGWISISNDEGEIVMVHETDIVELIDKLQTYAPTKLCNICRVARVPIGVHACDLCE